MINILVVTYILLLAIGIVVGAASFLISIEDDNRKDIEKLENPFIPQWEKDCIKSRLARRKPWNWFKKEK